MPKDKKRLGAGHTEFEKSVEFGLGRRRLASSSVE